MFNNKPYLAVNREERFFCALFGHALLSSQTIRERFSELTQAKFHISMKPATFQIFLEAAALRDYWNDLGDPLLYSDETHTKRRAVLNAILSFMNIPADVIDKHHVFWTSEQRKKLWSPGRWDPKTLAEIGLERLKQVKWAFNAKPDILIQSDSNVLLIEGKLESGEGRDEEAGYQQFEIQQLIASLMKLLVPEFENVTFTNTVLALRPASGISWQEVITMIEGGGLDDFTVRCFSQLKRFYQ